MKKENAVHKNVRLTQQAILADEIHNCIPDLYTA